MRKRLLSFILAIVLLIGLFPTTAFAYGFGGGSEGDGGADGIGRIYTNTGGGKSYNWTSGVYFQLGMYYRGKYGVRLKAMPTEIPNLTPHEEKYWTLGEDKTIYMLPWDELVAAEGYNDASSWMYFFGGDAYDPRKVGVNYLGWQAHDYLYQIFDAADAQNTPSAWRIGSDTYNTFIKLCGKTPSNRAIGPEYLNELFKSDWFDPDKDPNAVEHRKALGEFFGLSAEAASGNYYIVAEQYIYGSFYVMDNNSVCWNPNVFLELAGKTLPMQEYAFTETRATYEAVDPGRKTVGYPLFLYTGTHSFFGQKLVSNNGNASTSATTWATTITGANWNQTTAPWEHLGCKMGQRQPEWNGYSVYGFGEMGGGNAFGNVAVEYQGDVNTSDPGQFVSTGALISSGESSTNAYWDFSAKRWMDSSDTATLLRFAGKIDTSEEYALCFTSTTGYPVENADIKIVPEMQADFEDAPGIGYSDSSLEWGNPQVEGYPVNVGYVWKVLTLDGCPNTNSIEEKFETAFNDHARVSGGSLNTGVVKTRTTDELKDKPVLDGSWENANLASSNSTSEIILTGEDGGIKLKQDETLGFGYEFIIRGTPVKSRKITIKIDGEVDADTGEVSNISVDSSQTWQEDYTTAKSTSCTTEAQDGYIFVNWFVVPGQEDSITSSIVGALNGLTDLDREIIKSTSLSTVDSSLIEAQGGSGTQIGLGSTDDEPPIGYTVYEIMYNKDIVIRPVVGEVVLPAYMLNRYFDNIIQTSSELAGKPTKFTLARDWTWVKWEGPQYCKQTGALVGYSSYKDDWVIEYWDAAGGNEFGLDNSMIDRYYPKGTGNWDSSVRSKLTNAWAESMDTRNMPENTYVVDYAFNLVRGNNDFGDKRSVSGISYTSYTAATGDSGDLLKINAQFGVTPTVVKNASPARNSVAPLASYKETFNIKSRFQYTGSEIGQHIKPKSHHYHKGWHGYHGSGDNRTPCNCVCDIWYWDDSHLYNVTCGGFMGQREGVVNTINYQFNNTAYKYTTKNDLGSGQNDFLGGSSSKPLSAGKRNATAGSITDSNFYRFTTVRYNNVELKFHPENYMVFKIGGTDFAQINGQPYVKAYVMSEVKRTSKSSGMYFFRLNGNVDSVPGTVYSDSMQGGTGIFGFGSTVSIPAGSDVTVAADPSVVDIDLYGYVLDLVQTEDDGKIGAVGAGRAYNTVVRNGANAYSEWGNNSRAEIIRHFNEWCDNMLKVENYAADFQLYVGSGTTELKSENFSATIGYVQKGEGLVEEGVYQLVVEKGILQTGKGDYNAMIQQIAEDYGCDTGTATAMFQESALYTAIINGMETCLNPKNKSKDVFYGLTYTPDILGSWTDELGGNGNWYDETSRTFVVRRFKNLGNKLCDVIATDKVDYQLAPSGSARPGENVNSGVSYNAWWHLNIFFDQNAASKVNDLLLGSSQYYAPQTQSPNMTTANGAYSVLYNSIPVANADFVIPASSTQDFYN